MQIEITMQPMFWLGLLRRDVDLLWLLAEHHYDGACRATIRSGGFLMGWHNITREQSPGGVYKEDAVAKCSATRRDLDTMLKICEGVRLAVSARIMTTEDGERINELCSTVMTALETATLACEATQLEPITAPTKKGALLWYTNPGRI